jgi:indole-3-glycerol phosphate synthase/phosphoribosylanthranilate isomerase
MIERDGDRLLFDNGEGGSGATFDWDLVRNHPSLATGLLAGGIGAANAGLAAALGAYALDVGSSVDEVPGIKSGTKIRALFDTLRPQCRQEARACA